MSRNGSERMGIFWKLGFVCCILAIAGAAGTLVSFMKRSGQEMKEVVSLGRVNLRIEEPKFSGQYDGNLLAGLLPGQAVEKDPVIVLGENSEDAYIRVRIEYGGVLEADENNTEEEEREREKRVRELEEGINFSEGWLKGRDAFYYYQKKVPSGSRIPFFTQVTIPESWGNEISEQAFSIDLTAEAVPADYFDPWSEDEEGNLLIEGWYYTDGTPVGMEINSGRE